ncbi:NUDIX domain-containing protein [Spongisporangium articulatum]|uniref:NUDIX domain-containing protein n=1 Tax=Spongisporangium articulatum TaxID=3362603 RepID=A0ABW8AKK8_9ACTN
MGDVLRTRIDADLVLEGEPEPEFVPGVAATFPRKRVSAAVLVRDAGGRVLLLEQSYRSTWGLPGGVLEDDEPPLTGVLRELREELGVEWPVGRMLAVDWAPRHGVWGDAVHFLFDGGVVDARDVAGFRLEPGEIDAVHLVEPAAVGAHTRPSLARRVAAGLDAVATGRTHLLTFGRRMES